MSESREHTEGGDPVCWLNRVCDECGAFREDMAARACARCGTPFPAGDGVEDGADRERTDPGSPRD